jgi:hypothetical protein
VETGRGWSLFLIALMLLGPVFAGESGPDEQAENAPSGMLDLHRSLPRDPLLALAIVLDDPEQEVEAILAFLAELGGEQTRQGLDRSLAQLDEGLGSSIRHKLLPLLGPQLTVAVDLPPIDYAILTLASPSHEALTAVLGGIGLVAEVRDPARLDAELRALLESAAGELLIEEDRVGIRIPISIREGDVGEEASRRSYVVLQYMIRDGKVAIGFSADWVRDALRPGPSQDRLASGEDFARVFAQLDPRAIRLSYVNLPKIRSLVSESHILSAVFEDGERTGRLLQLVAESEAMGLGLGSTSVAMNGGVRTIHFGPRWLSDAVISGGMLAAVAVPGLILARDDEEKGRLTSTQIERIGAACEGFSADTQTYPPADGWVTVESIAPFLEPLYATELPRQDAWENPILYWSDGRSYRILSTGEDGEIDRDWTGIDAAGHPVRSGADIAFGDGRFLAAP